MRLSSSFPQPHLTWNFDPGFLSMAIPLFLLTCITFIFIFPRWGWKLLFTKRKPQSSAADQDDGIEAVSRLLDLPEPILDAILERLPPVGLCKMGAVSTFLREKCISDHLWDRHMKSKWGRIIGSAAYQEWQCNPALSNDPVSVKDQKGLVQRVLEKLYQASTPTSLRCPLPADSILSRYLALENGAFWFPAQVFNRQNGHFGFLLSCYDAKLIYDHRTDTFQARYPAYGTLEIPIEKNVKWDRLRSPPTDIGPYNLFESDSLKELHPGDHVEIQWRRNKDLPYGWWYSVVGHLDSCDGNEANCHCSTSDTIVLEFKQYLGDSRWRKTSINRRDHREKGNEEDGFYGGIRRLESSDEISRWQQLWPAQALESV